MITKFTEFINEELKSETYIKAGEKLNKTGHTKRGNNLIDYGKKKETEESKSILCDGKKWNINNNSIDVKFIIFDNSLSVIGWDVTDKHSKFLKMSFKINDGELVNKSTTFLDDRKSANILIKIIKEKLEIILKETKKDKDKSKLIKEFINLLKTNNLFKEKN